MSPGLLHLVPRLLLFPVAYVLGLGAIGWAIWFGLLSFRKAFATWIDLCNDFRRRNWLGMDRRKQDDWVGGERRTSAAR